MTKQDWETKIIQLKARQFRAERQRNEGAGLLYAQACIAAYKTVYLQEGK